MDRVIGLGFDRLANLERRADWYRALGDDDSLAIHRGTDRRRNAKHVLQIGRAIFIWRRTHGNEDDPRRTDRVSCVRRKSQPPFFDIPFDDLFEAWLIDRDDPVPELPDLFLVDIDAHDGVASLSQACARNQPDVASANDSNLHEALRAFEILSRRATSSYRRARYGLALSVTLLVLLAAPTRTRIVPTRLIARRDWLLRCSIVVPVRLKLGHIRAS